MIHAEQHPQAGQTVTVTTDLPLHGLTETSVDFIVEDWWDRLSGGSWMFARGNPACLAYAMRSGLSGLPTDNEVVYGKTKNGLGHLVHASELQGGA